MCFFPNIEYNAEVPPLNAGQDRLPNGVMAMINILNNRQIWPNLDKINNMTRLENRIINLINNYNNNPDEYLLEIFHLIQIWGGRTGRNVYVMNGGIAHNLNMQAYRNLVDVCINQDSTNEEIYDASYTFYINTNQIGISFITKHVRFWNMRARGNNALPIYDTIMAINIMNTQPRFNNLLHYWNCMIVKALEEGINILALERQLFNYFNM